MEFLLSYILALLEFLRGYFIHLLVGYLSFAGPGLVIVGKE